MNRWLGRPRAQSRNAQTRRAAVAADPLDALGRPLAEFAREDSDAGVRRAALRRAADLALTRERMHADPDPGVREAATAVYRKLMAGGHPPCPPLAERLAHLHELDDPALLEHLARHAGEAALREAALARLDRPGLTLDCLLNDPDPALRQRLLAGIDDPAQLERIIRRSHRRDRTVHRAAQARLRALRLNAGDPSAILREAERICQQLERMPGKRPEPDAIDLLESRWQTVAGGVDAVLATRYRHALAQARTVAEVPADGPRELHAPQRRMPRMNEPEHPSGRVSDADPAIVKLAAEHRFRAHLAASAGTEAAPCAPTAPPAPAVDPSHIRAQLDALEQALETGDMNQAEARARELASQAQRMPERLHPRWQRAQGRVSELKRWQSWSNRRQRRQLCVDARALRHSALHPEALATRIRELRKAWQTLDALEPAPSRERAADAALRRRFHALCQRALAPTRAWFQQRDDARRQHTEGLRALLDEAAPEAGDSRAQAERRRRLAAARRSLQQAEPAARKPLAAQLNRAIRSLDAALREHHRRVSQAHDALIDRAVALMQLEPRQRPAEARNLQAEWKALGPGRRDLDRSQWQRFRRALDDVFAERDRQRQRQSAEREAALHQAGQWLEALQARLAQGSEQADALLADAERRWRRFDQRDPSLQTRWRALRQDLEQRARTQRVETLRDRYRAWLDEADAPHMPAALAQAWRQRASSAADSGRAHAIVVRLEALAGLESPTVDASQRLQARLERLQARMGRASTPQDELEALLAAWIRMGPLADADGALDARWRAALEAMLERIG